MLGDSELYWPRGRLALVFSAPTRVLMLRNLCLGLALLLASVPAHAVAEPAPILFTRLAFEGGSAAGTTIDGGRLVLAAGQTEGPWPSPPVDPGFGSPRLGAPWTAEPPADGRVRVEVQA